MPYIINNSRGDVIAVVADGTVNTSATPLTLVGRAVTSYGEAENENYVFILENFANSAAPLRAVLGQLWYNSATDILSVYNLANAWAALATEIYVQEQKISPIFTGVPEAPTPPSGDNSARIATTAFVQGEKFSPTFTGVPRAPTPPSDTNSTQIATTAFVYSVTGTLGTMSQQNANAVSITGGTIAGITPLRVSDGGTGASTAPAARVNLGVGTLGTQNANAVAITGGSITGIAAIPIESGGTSATSAIAARNNLGLGSIAVQDSDSVAITGGSITGIVPLPLTAGGTGASTASQARINLGLGTGATVNTGTMALQNADAVAIVGGTISGITPLPVASGGTGSATAGGALNNLGAVPTSRTVTGSGGLAGGGALTSNLQLTIATDSNGFGRRYVSTSTPTGGVDGDIWYQI
jgi:hypothetical protein